MKHRTKYFAFILCLTATQSTPAEFFKSDVAHAIQVGAIVGTGMSILGIAGEHILLQHSLANAYQNLHLINSVDGVHVTSVDLVGRGFFQKKRVTLENKMWFKAIIESELILLEHTAQEPMLSRSAKTMIRFISVGGFMGLFSNLIIGMYKAHGINSLADFNKFADPSSESYQKRQTFIIACDNFKKATFGATEFKTIFAGFMSLIGTLAL